MSQASRRLAHVPHSDTLADILERVLETGIVIAGDIKINLNNVELLTIQIRLIICSVDKAREIGMDWWTSAPYLTSNPHARLPDGSLPGDLPAALGATSPHRSLPQGAPAAAPEAAAPGAAVPEAASAQAAGEPSEEVVALNERLARLEWQLARLLSEEESPSASARPPGSAPGRRTGGDGEDASPGAP